MQPRGHQVVLRGRHLLSEAPHGSRKGCEPHPKGPWRRHRPPDRVNTAQRITRAHPCWGGCSSHEAPRVLLEAGRGRVVRTPLHRQGNKSRLHKLWQKRQFQNQRIEMRIPACHALVQDGQCDSTPATVRALLVTDLCPFGVVSWPLVSALPWSLPRREGAALCLGVWGRSLQLGLVVSCDVPRHLSVQALAGTLSTACSRKVTENNEATQKEPGLHQHGAGSAMATTGGGP